MAITDVTEYAHLSDADVEALAVELDAIRPRHRSFAWREGPDVHPAHHRCSNAVSTSPPVS